MITSIFNKSKPLNFTIVFFITLLAFVVANLESKEESISVYYILGQATIFLFCYLSILVLNFVVSKNSLTLNNNYEVLLFSLFLLAIKQTTLDVNILFSNLFVLLALRRLLSLRSQISINKKLFDAAFWIAIAALFYFWAILFFILILVSLILYTDNKLNYWIIPFVGLITVFLLGVSLSVLMHNNYFEIFKSLPEVSYDFSNYNSPKYLIAITMLFSFGLWSSIFYVKSIKQKKKALRPSFNIVLVMVILAFSIVILAPKKGGSEFLFLFAPLAIIITNYLENIPDKWFKEVFLSVLIIVPFVLLVL